MDKTAALASDILRGIGGEQNILRLENCMTRVRVEVQDDSQLDIPRLKALPGVSGYVKQGEQHQLIVGPGKAAQVVDAMRVQIAAGGVKPDDAMARTKSEAKAKYKAPMSDALRKLANVFIPLIPAFIASGLITGIINILKRPDIVGDVAVHYPNLLGLMGIFGSAVFAIMNILVGVNTAKVFGGSQALGGVMAGILSSPQLAQITLFGEALQPGRGGAIAVLLVVALMCWIERQFRKLLPGSLELILNPLLTTVITGAVAIVALQPLGGWISDAIAHGASWAIDRGGFLVGAVLAGTFLPLVLTGLHQGLVPIHVELVQAHGYNALFPILAMAGVGQIGAAIAVLMKTRNARLKKVIKGALPVGLLGIGEPLIFGVTLPLGKPFIGACLGGAVGGALISYWKVATVITFGISGLPLALTIVAGKVLFYLLGYLIAVIAGFIFTWLLGFNDPEE
ncbi:PTS transporter subunit EIIC [Salmonella enterica]|uniref:PTS system N-acetylmuramic acid-specific EIIBC component n=1 Tax=Salmonella oranienberg TaxID=28147 RepID=A0A3V8V2C7_SALON|nr:PTS transporter subunit EIIC [Salmonella enterica]EBP9963067.1 PTS sugar transporter subunit IIC [Salmonella enterica subsp. enterica]EDP9061792.1 PTS sugar transporter subunit IIC [Salmonella enterica subsp. enterica serovar Minnesota]ESP76463.1 phosphotransferase system, eiic [Salmonella enterica subsp. enterica serovar Saintpaul str. S-70]AUM44496.1 PTS sugar transporter subunit IIC [Salmonella enterica subsp. enterica serovar Oranienburg str. 0250]EAA5253589.1 PTS sugar transporter subu